MNARHCCAVTRSRRAARAIVTLLGLMTVAAVCGSCSASTGSAGTGLPSFYSVPSPLPKSGPGTLLKSERIADPGLRGVVYRVMYLSESVSGRPVPVTGLIVVPIRSAPASGYPVVSWAHDADGLAGRCAPSLDPTTDIPLANNLLNQGWEIAASDYQGEGTPGLLPYLVGASAAHDVIDIVRAARQLRAAHTSSGYVVWGLSEGGQAALFALHVAPSYAPELSLKGVVAGAPVSQFFPLYLFLQDSPYRYDWLMTIAGFNSAYGTRAAPLDDVLTPLGMSLLPDLEKGCSAYIAGVADKYRLSQILKTDPYSVPAWKTLLQENDPFTFTTASTVPLLIIQGSSDDQVPVAITTLLANHFCDLGQDLEQWVYPGQSHGVIAPSTADMIKWMADRFDDDPNPDPFTPVGLPDIGTTTCPS
jgi:hypothetical protein